jgi:mono/diheme cytochrome c family protein
MARRKLLTAAAICAVAALYAGAAENSAADRGRKHLLQDNYIPAIWSRDAYDNAWQRWQGPTVKPADYDAAFRETYGLNPAPYPNGNLPMGLRDGPRLLGKGVSIDCLACHGGSVMGQSVIGLGNASLDVQALFEDLNAGSGLPSRLPMRFSNVRGTSEAGGMSVYLLSHRNPDLSFRRPSVDLELHDQMCEDPPAWWLLHKKKTMYQTGGSDAHSVRSLMQFMMGSINGPAAFDKAEADFADIQQYLYSLRPPKYPLSIDRALAARGEAIFTKTCARCHGTYGEDWTYPNKIVPLHEIGTDPARYRGITAKFGSYYDQSWFGQTEKNGGTAYSAKATDGYQAPPLDGIWATAPYFHNGSSPTVYHVLNSKARPKRFTRSYRTTAEDFDPVRLGWKYREVESIDSRLSPREGRKTYDTTQPGRSNGGHVYGDDLGDEQRMAVIEYLKTL